MFLVLRHLILESFNEFVESIFPHFYQTLTDVLELYDKKGLHKKFIAFSKRSVHDRDVFYKPAE